jgi:hypothetical protein
MNGGTKELLLVATMAFVIFASNAIPASPSQDSEGILVEKPGVSSSGQACTVDIPAASDPVHNQEDLDTLMRDYFAVCYADLSVIDRVFDDETPDEQWARRIEKEIADVAAEVHGLTVEGECRRSICRFDFISSNGKDNLALLLQFNQIFIPRIKRSKDSIGCSNIPAGVNVSREYFYSEVLPVAFISAFLERMGRPSAQQSVN